jgi:multiple sugar transport system substrate-binding protein
MPPHPSIARAGLRRSGPLVAGTFFLLLGLTGCTRPDAKENTITYGFWGTVEQQKTERAVIAAFEVAHPGVRVVAQPHPGTSMRYNDKMQAMLVGQVAPDVIMIEAARYDDWRARGVLADLTAEVESLAREYELMPVARQAFMREGRFYAAPINVHGYVTFYNRTALAATGLKLPADGLTWEWLLAVAPRLARRAGDPAAPTDYAMQLPFPTMIFWAYGGRMFDDLYRPTRATVNTPAGLAAIDYLRRSFAQGTILPPDIGAMAADHGTFQLFRDGKVAFFFSGRWVTPDLMGVRNFSWDVLPMPRGPGGSISQHGGTLLGLWAGSKNPELARRFIRFYASAEGTRRVMAGRRYVPVYRQLAYGPEFLALTPPQSLHVFADTMEAGASMFYLYAPGMGEVKRLFDAAMEKAMIRPDIPAPRILADLETELNHWIAENPPPS